MLTTPNWHRAAKSRRHGNPRFRARLVIVRDPCPDIGRIAVSAAQPNQGGHGGPFAKGSTRPRCFRRVIPNHAAVPHFWMTPRNGMHSIRSPEALLMVRPPAEK